MIEEGRSKKEEGKSKARIKNIEHLPAEQGSGSGRQAESRYETECVHTDSLPCPSGQAGLVTFCDDKRSDLMSEANKK